VSKVFDDGTLAVENFSLTLPSQKTTVFVGSSGSGKTTLLRMINRMIEPSSGHIFIDGEDIAELNPVRLRHRIGYVLQAAGLLPHRTVLDNIATVPRLNGVSKTLARAAGLALLRTVGLDSSLARRYPSQLSGGQQQRVGVARALASDPKILLMDEPFGAVDPIVLAELQAELIRLQRELGKTIVFVTHDIDEAFTLADQVVILKQGGVIAQVGTPAQILAEPADDFVASFIGADTGKRQLFFSVVKEMTTSLSWWTERVAPPAFYLRRRRHPRRAPGELDPRQSRSDCRAHLQSHPFERDPHFAFVCDRGSTRLGGEPQPHAASGDDHDRQLALHNSVFAPVCDAALHSRHTSAERGKRRSGLAPLWRRRHGEVGGRRSCISRCTDP
jgi:osmoprotectant transport system ATP-binding protein